MTVPATTPQLPGRERELADAVAVLGASAAGQLRVMVLTGEPGIGKSRLLDAIETLAVARGFQTVRTVCDEESMPVAFAPLQQVVAELGQSAGLEEHPESLAEHLRRLPREATEPELRLAATDYIARVIRARSAGQPVAILIDDVQWLDESSASVLRRLIRTVRYVPVTLVVAYRGDDPRVTGAGDRFISQVSSDPVCRLVPLRRLPDDATRSIVATHLGTSSDEVAALSDEIQRQSEGVPLYVVELISHLQRSDLLTRRNGQWHADATQMEGIPLNIRALLDQRLDRLGDTHRDVLEVAAVLGSDIEDGTLRAVVDLCAPHLAEHIDDALARSAELGLILEDTRADSTASRFGHQLYRDRLYAGTGHGTRRSIHDAAATVLEATTANGEQVERVAYHAIRGRDPLVGVHAARRAARAAADIHAWEDAVQWIDVAIDLLSSMPPGDPIERPARADQQIALAIERDTYVAVVGDPTARQSSAEILERLAIEAATASRRSELLVRATRGMVAGGALDRAEKLAAQLAGLADNEEIDETAQLWIAVGEAAIGRSIGEPAPVRCAVDGLQRARSAFHRALFLVPETPTSIRGSLLQELGVVEAALADRGLLERRVAHERLRAALDVYRLAKDRRGETTILIALAYRRNIEADRPTSGNSDRFVSFLEEIRRLRAAEHRIVGATDQPRAEALSLLSTQLYCRTKGWYELALERGAQARRWADESRDPRVGAMVEIALSECNWLVGRGARALEHAERALAALDQLAAHPSADSLLHWQALAARVRAHLAMGDTTRATHLARQAASDEGNRRGATTGQVEALLVEALEANRHIDEARALAEGELRGAVGLSSGTIWDIQLDLALSRMALVSEDGRSAVGHAAAAAARLTERRTPFVWLRLAAGTALVASLLATGHEREARDAARDPAELAATVLSRISDPTLWDETASAAPYLADFLRIIEPRWPELMPTPMQVTAEISHPLTARELEVMRLVASGRSNQEIADTLFISVKTVARHLTNVYTKIGAESRTQAAAWAYRNRIV